MPLFPLMQARPPSAACFKHALGMALCFCGTQLYSLLNTFHHVKRIRFMVFDVAPRWILYTTVAFLQFVSCKYCDDYLLLHIK